MNIRKTNQSITRKLTTIENALKRKLNAFYNSNIKDSIFPIETLRQKYETQVKALIRKTVQDAYLSGSNLVTDQLSNDFVPFISVSDINNIQSLTEKTNAQFWTTASRLHRRESEFVAVGGDLEPKPEFDVLASIIGFSAFTAFEAFNQAQLLKIQQLGLDAQVVFKTAGDVKVDPAICEPLSDTVFSIGELDETNTPPLHLHCRCRLVSVINDEDLGLNPEGSII